jgi:hypothetical protein
MPDKTKRGLNVIKCYLQEWWFPLTIGYLCFATALFLFCVMWTTAFLGVASVGQAVFWNGVVIYELVLLGVVFVFVFFGSYRKSKVFDVT